MAAQNFTNGIRIYDGRRPIFVGSIRAFGSGVSREEYEALLARVIELEAGGGGGPSLPVVALGSPIAQDEGNSGTTNFVYPVTRTGDLSAASSVQWAVTGTANAADFVGGVLPSGTVNFAIGSASQNITVPVAGDVTVEGDETFTVTLSVPVNATIGTATAGGTIENDDAAVLPVISLGSPVSQAEGNSGTTNFTYPVTRTGDLTGTSSADWAVSVGTASAADFVGGVLPSGTINFGVGSASQNIVVPVAGDITVESDEAFTVTLSAPTNATIGTATSGGTITDDDAVAGPPTPVLLWVSDGNTVDPVFDWTEIASGDTAQLEITNVTDSVLHGDDTNVVDGAEAAAGIVNFTGIPSLLYSKQYSARGRYQRAGVWSAWSAAVLRTMLADETDPIITSSVDVSIAENLPLDHAVTANEPITVSIVGGADAADLEVFSGNRIRWAGNVTRNFEAPDDTGTNNVYDVILRLTDTSPALNSYDVPHTFTVTNVADTLSTNTTWDPTGVDPGVAFSNSNRTATNVGTLWKPFKVTNPKTGRRTVAVTVGDAGTGSGNSGFGVGSSAMSLAAGYVPGYTDGNACAWYADGGFGGGFGGSATGSGGFTIGDVIVMDVNQPAGTIDWYKVVAGELVLAKALTGATIPSTFYVIGGHFFGSLSLTINTGNSPLLVPPGSNAYDE